MATTTVTATLSRGGTTLELPLLAQAGDPITAVDYGKPNMVTHSNGGATFPRTTDAWSGLEQFNLIGMYRGSSAYGDIISLADFILSDGGAEVITLDIPAFSELDSNIAVAPSAGADRALNINYEPGRKNTVQFDLGLTRVRQALGDYNRSITTPTASGTGPLTLSNGTTTVELAYDLTVDRYVGRPNDVVRKTPVKYPNHEIKSKVVNDEFEISLLFSDSDVVTVTKDIADVIGSRQNRGALTLDFQGLYGMGAFDVMPAGSQALRHVRQSGEEGVTIIPTIALRRVNA